MRKPRKSVRAVLIAVMLLAGMLAGSTSATAQGPNQSYIVVLDRGTPNVPAVAANLARAHGGQVGFVYEHALQGFSISVSPQGAAALARNPRVAYVEADSLHTIAAQDVPTGIDRIFASGNAALDIDGTDDFRVNVDVAVIDTGVDFEHPDLNVVGGVNCASGGPFGGGCVTGGDDDHYHGTHVAGTIGALDNDFGVVGVAPGARIWSVKVLSKRGSGYTSWIVAGIDWVAANADTIEVANMSLGGSGFNQAEYDAIQGAVNRGVAFAVAAGNSDADANNYSPAAFDNVLTVSALADFDGAPGGGAKSTCRNDVDDTLANFSNWGPAVDIAAPGVCITSTYPLEQGSYGTISGTSMASPHVAGALALLASVSNPGDEADVVALYSQVAGAGNTNWTDEDPVGPKEPLLDLSNTGLFAPTFIAGSGGGGGGGGPTDTPPTVSITSPSDGATFASGAPITFEGSASDAEDGDLSGSIAWTADGESIGSGSSVTIVLGDGEHTIIASATDGDSNTVTDSITVTVNSSGGGGGEGGITLTATGTKVKGEKYVDLVWSGASGSFVDLYRNGEPVGPTANDGSELDSWGEKGGGTTTYRLCETNSPTACAEATVVW